MLPDVVMVKPFGQNDIILCRHRGKFHYQLKNACTLLHTAGFGNFSVGSFGGEWGVVSRQRSLFPSFGGVPRRGGVVGATQNHPVRLGLTPL
jgi:hypothetical protein